MPSVSLIVIDEASVRRSSGTSEEMADSPAVHSFGELRRASSWNFQFSSEKHDAVERKNSHRLLLAVLLLLAVASFSLHLAEGWGVLDTCYFVAATVTTVGYGDISPSTAGGKVRSLPSLLWPRSPPRPRSSPRCS